MLDCPLGPSLRLATALARLRDAETGRHHSYVARYARIAAAGLGLEEVTPEWLAALEACVAVHDVGKIGIADDILLKPSTLTRGEILVVQNHTIAGAAIIEDLVMDREYGFENWQFVTMLRAVVRSHHERPDGAGYPDGLRGPKIPLAARVTAVADVFDALTTGRPYKRAWPEKEALYYLSRHAGSQFDEDCVRAFLHNADEIISLRRTGRPLMNGDRDKA